MGQGRMRSITTHISCSFLISRLVFDFRSNYYHCSDTKSSWTIVRPTGKMHRAKSLFTQMENKAVACLECLQARVDSSRRY